MNVILQTQSLSWVSERSDIAMTWNGNRYTDAYKALAAMQTYVQNNSMVASADHVALFTE